VKEHAAGESAAARVDRLGSTLPYLAEIAPASDADRERPVDHDRRLHAGDVAVLRPRARPWSVESEPAALARGDIASRRRRTTGGRAGKCGFKIIQYMAAGLPVVASPVGANAEIVRVGETGLLATTPQEWIDTIRRLAADVNLRAGLGRAGRERVEARVFSIARAADVWTRLLQQ
jgi:hypothetical protein